MPSGMPTNRSRTVVPRWTGRQLRLPAGRLHPARQDGVTIVELAIVMAIVLILIGAGYYMFASARTAGYSKSIATSARAYSDAITAFRLDHRRVPVLGDSNDWPVTNAGPVDLVGKPLIRGGVPEAVDTGLTGIDSTASSASTGTRGRIIYERINDQQYRLIVFVGDSTAGFEEYCQIGNGVAPGTPTC